MMELVRREAPVSAGRRPEDEQDEEECGRERQDEAR